MQLVSCYLSLHWTTFKESQQDELHIRAHMRDLKLVSCYLSCIDLFLRKSQQNKLQIRAQMGDLKLGLLN